MSFKNIGGPSGSGPSNEEISVEVARQHRRHNSVSSDASIEPGCLVIGQGDRKVASTTINETALQAVIKGRIAGRDIAEDGKKLDTLFERAPTIVTDFGPDIDTLADRISTEARKAQEQITRCTDLTKQYMKGASDLTARFDLLAHKIPDLGPIEVRIAAVARSNAATNAALDNQVSDLRAQLAAIPKPRSMAPVVVLAIIWPFVVVGAFIALAVF